MDQVIGVDIGTQSTKAVLVARPMGASWRRPRRAYAPETPRPSTGRSSMARRVARRRGGIASPPVMTGFESAGGVKAVCVSSLYGGSGIPVDADMRPAPPLPDLDGPPGRGAGRAGSRTNVDLDASRPPSPAMASTAITASPRSCGCATSGPTSGNARTKLFLPPNAYVIHRLDRRGGGRPFVGRQHRRLLRRRGAAPGRAETMRAPRRPALA